jgi:hypothetical protein
MASIPQESISVPNPLKESDLQHALHYDSAADPILMELISMDEYFDLANSKPVPLVEPGKLVTEKDFVDAVSGIDFAHIFY